ncbi:MAG: DUF1540 domain-containing protein [Clostridia bacterium]|nr:DUF1540 domain-containing protein [Clostridia bacterium]
MNENQKINCTVGSCRYNNSQNNMCQLQSIVVRPTENCNSQNTDESQCGSYRVEK